MVVDIRLLGDVQVRIDGRVIDLGHARQRCVLVALLVEPNRPVPIDRLVDRVWADRPPQRARGALHNYVSRLRQVLAATEELKIGRRPAGYVVTVEAMAVDLCRFHHLLTRARSAADNGDDPDAAALLDRALGLWSGDALATLDTPWVNAVRDDLDRQRRAAELDRNDLALDRGRHTALLAELSAAAAARPLDERLAGQLLLALCRSGRQADALAHYQGLRRQLADELGADPSPPLQRLHQQILTADPALTAPTAASQSSPPHQLPAAPRTFTGRTDELVHLDALLTDHGEDPTAVVVALTGTAGIGKTALAVYWAHRVADRFPDGQLYVNLRGFDSGGQTMAPDEAIRGFLTALGVPPQHIPVDHDARTALYRSKLAGRRILIVADNARDAAHVRPLLPGASGCLVLVTSRSQLAGLVAADGAHPVPLDLPSTAEARELLARRLGEHRVAAQPQVVDDIIAGCARLPLALAVVAARAAAYPRFGLDKLAKELHETRGRLDAFADEEDATIDIRAVFSWSYDRLSAAAARLFRLLGLTVGPDLAAPAAASLIGVPPARVRPLLAELSRAHLIVEHAPGRYTFHDLLRAYATEQTHAHDSDADRHAAIGRALEHYLSRAAATTEALHPGTRQRTADVAPATPGPRPGDRSAARAWLDAERVNLVAACRYAAEHGWTTHSAELTRVLTHYLDTGGHYTDAYALHAHAREVSRRTGDLAGEAHALTSLGLVHFRRGELGPAAEQLRHALTLTRRIGDPHAEAGTLIFLGAVCWRRCELSAAAEYVQLALIRCRQVGDRSHEAWALTYLGAVCWRRGESGRAAEHLHHALTLSRQVGEPAAEAGALAYLGAVCWRRGELRLAAEHVQRALVRCRQVGNPADEAWVSALLGGILSGRGEFWPAAEQLHRALAMSRQVGDRAAEAFSLTMLGALCGQQGDHPRAVEHLHQALTLARQVGDRATEADALAALGLVYGRHGERDPAIAHLQQALLLCRQLGARVAEAGALNGLGETLRTTGSVPESRIHHTHALTVATEIGALDEQARAHEGIAISHHAGGNLDLARHHWQQALTHYAQLDLPGADRVRTEISRLPPT